MRRCDLPPLGLRVTLLSPELPYEGILIRWFIIDQQLFLVSLNPKIVVSAKPDVLITND